MVYAQHPPPCCSNPATVSVCTHTHTHAYMYIYIYNVYKMHVHTCAICLYFHAYLSMYIHMCKDMCAYVCTYTSNSTSCTSCHGPFAGKLVSSGSQPLGWDEDRPTPPNKKTRPATDRSGLLALWGIKAGWVWRVQEGWF